MQIQWNAQISNWFTIINVYISIKKKIKHTVVNAGGQKSHTVENVPVFFFY